MSAKIDFCWVKAWVYMCLSGKVDVWFERVHAIINFHNFFHRFNAVTVDNIRLDRRTWYLSPFGPSVLDLLGQEVIEDENASGEYDTVDADGGCGCVIAECKERWVKVWHTTNAAISTTLNVPLKGGVHSALFMAFIALQRTLALFHCLLTFMARKFGCYRSNVWLNISCT